MIIIKNNRELLSFEQKHDPPDSLAPLDREDKYDFIYREGETKQKLDFEAAIILYFVPITILLVYLLFFTQ
ncbi:MAG: hypothetical protein K6B74_02895 [Ruminococcus sp.]|nr:hypothetical protein [Ruminococcus sp.]